MNKRTVLLVLATVSFFAGVATQASFLFTGGSQLQTILSVLLLAAASVFFLCAHVGGLRTLGVVSAIVAIGFFAEAIGVATGIPFGEYAYSGGLGASLLGVSMIVPFAWLMMTVPAWLMSRTVATGDGWASRITRIVYGATALVAWDVFLDTQMVTAGNWGWAHPEPSLIGTPGIPLTNYVGWFVVGVVLMAVCEILLWRHQLKVQNGLTPIWVYVWTWLGSIIANLTFWDRPELALAGGIAMGCVLCVFVWRLGMIRRRKRVG